jgi:hypothetical protein
MLSEYAGGCDYHLPELRPRVGESQGSQIFTHH